MILSAPELGDEVRIQIIHALSISPSAPFRTALRTVLKQNPSPTLSQAATQALNLRMAQSAGGTA